MLPYPTSFQDFYQTSFQNINLVLSYSLPFPDCVFQLYRDLLTKLEITAVDVILTILVALLLLFIRYYVINPTTEDIARFMGVPKSKIENLKESGWFLTYYLVASVIDLHIVAKYKLFSDRGLLFYKYPSRDSYPLDLWTFRIFQTGYYVQGLFTVFFCDIYKSDTFAIKVHHCMTISLQSLSYGAGYLYSGNIIECLHDFNDVFLHFAKIFHYFTFSKNVNREVWDRLSLFSFVCFSVSWLITRTFTYNFSVIFTIFYNSNGIVDYSTPFTLTFICLLLLLCILNTYWLVLILKIVFSRVFTKTPLHDIREEDSDMYEMHKESTDQRKVKTN